MYQALYRKYRPNNFDEVIGQEVIVKSFKNAIKYNMLSHAYIFTGPRGTGKTSVAKIVGKYVNCTQLKNFTPCNVCVNCTQFNNKETTDIIEMDAASNNGIDEIRELKSKVNLVPSNGKYKIYIIDEVHMLTVGAFNALLKTLEEPPSHVIFILATTDPHKVPTTILSRCQRFDFKKIPISQLIKKLNDIVKHEKIEVEDGVLSEIARLSDGGARDAISLLDQAAAYADSEITLNDIHEMNGTASQIELEKIVSSILKKNLLEVFEQFDYYDATGKNLIKLTEEILLFLRNILLYKTVPEYFKNKNSDIDPYKNLESEMSIEQLLEIINQFNDAINKMKSSSNPKLMFELIVIRITNMGKKEPENPQQLKKTNKTLEKKDIQIEEKSLFKTKSDQKKYIINEQVREKLIHVKQTRIENTLANFKKQTLLDLRKQFENFRSLVLNSATNECASLILEGEIKAASDEYIILVLKKEWMSDFFNEKLLLMEPLFEKVYNKKYKIISVFTEEWDYIKKEFNKKQKEYTMREEDYDLLTILGIEKTKTDIESVFGDIIEYS